MATNAKLTSARRRVEIVNFMNFMVSSLMWRPLDIGRKALGKGVND
jgi:hypothetical protein